MCVHYVSIYVTSSLEENSTEHAGMYVPQAQLSTEMMLYQLITIGI